MCDCITYAIIDFHAFPTDYSDLNHLPEKEFYRELNSLKQKQQELTQCKTKKTTKRKCHKSNSNNNYKQFDHVDITAGNNIETRRNVTERISFAGRPILWAAFICIVIAP